MWAWDKEHKEVDMEHYKRDKHELVEDTKSCPLHICNFEDFLSL
jgi:hypothetical protein